MATQRQSVLHYSHSQVYVREWKLQPEPGSNEEFDDINDDDSSEPSSDSDNDEERPSPTHWRQWNAHRYKKQNDDHSHWRQWKVKPYSKPDYEKLPQRRELGQVINAYGKRVKECRGQKRSPDFASTDCLTSEGGDADDEWSPKKKDAGLRKLEDQSQGPTQKTAEVRSHRLCVSVGNSPSRQARPSRSENKMVEFMLTNDSQLKKRNDKVSAPMKPSVQRLAVERHKYQNLKGHETGLVNTAGRRVKLFETKTQKQPKEKPGKQDLPRVASKDNSRHHSSQKTHVLDSLSPESRREIDTDHFDEDDGSDFVPSDNESGDESAEK